MHQEVKTKASRSFNYTEEKQMYGSIRCMDVAAFESAMPNGIQSQGLSQRWHLLLFFNRKLLHILFDLQQQYLPKEKGLS